MGVVTDLGSRDAVISRSRPNSRHITKILIRDVATPTVQPTRTGSQFFFSNSSLAYTETAIQAVAGPKKRLIRFPPT